MKFLLSLFTWFIFFYSIAYSHVDSSYSETGEVYENLVEPDENEDNSDIYDVIEDLVNNPVDLNKAGIPELNRIPFINYTSAELIVNHRKKYGSFISVSELNSVKDLPVDLIEKISPFLKVIQEKSKREKYSKEYSINFRSRSLKDLQQRKGFSEKKYAGSEYKIYNRIKIKYTNIEAGFLTDKDAGENSINDFLSYYLSLKNLGVVQGFVAGNYLVEFGQGLALWSPYGFSKGSDAVYPAKKRSHRIRPYTSSMENNFFRGAATSLKLNNFSFTGFYSKNVLDANIDSIAPGIISTPVDGLHRTESELSKKQSAEETAVGSAISFNKDFINAGILYYHSEFNHPFIPASLYDIEGDNFQYYSFYYDLFLGKINLFGEVAYNGTSTASINGIEIPVSKSFTFVSSIRSYPRNFNNLHGFSFGERSGAVKNEFGIYNGFRLRTSFGIFNMYYDQFKFPFVSYGNPLPAEGDEFLLNYSVKPFRNFETRIKYKYEKKETGAGMDQLIEMRNRLKQSIRGEIIFRFKKTRLRSRFEYNKINITDKFEEGYLVYQDLYCQALPDLGIYTRIVFFRTNSFNSAVYEYENDLTGILYNTALFGQGIRWYIYFRYRPLNILTISFKYSETFKPAEKSMGSGLSEINGNLDNRLSLQIDFNY